MPELSCYKTFIAAKKAAIDSAVGEQAIAAAKKEYIDAIKAYGIKVTASITVKDKATAKGKLKITDAKKLKQSFTAEQYTQSRYEGEQQIPGEYYVEIPYTLSVPMPFEMNIESSNPLIRFDVVSGNPNSGHITAVVTKKGLEEAIADESVKYGETLKDITATVSFGDGTVSETFKVKLTLPGEKAATFSEVNAAIEAAVPDLEAMQGEYWQDGEENEIKECNVAKVHDAAAPMVLLDSDTEITFATKSYQAPSSKLAGSQVITITLKDLTKASGAEGATETTDVTLTIPKLPAAPADYKSVVDAWLLAHTNGYATNALTMEQFNSDIRTAINLPSTLRFSINTTFSKTDATSEKAGKIELDYVIYDIRNGNSEATGTGTLTIAQLTGN